MEHKFSCGDLVSVGLDRGNPNVRPGIYEITRVLPITNRVCQYRAKSKDESHERVLDEAQLAVVRRAL